MDWLTFGELLAVQAVVSFAVFLVLLPTKFGEKLLGHRFDRALAEHKRKQDEQVEGLKERLNHVGDRAKRSNEREYKALEDVWNKYVESHQAVTRAIVNFIRTSDLNRMSQEDLRAFAEGNNLSPSQQEFLLESSDKNRAYSRVMQARALSEAQNELYDLNLLLTKNGIFIPETLKTTFEDGMKTMREAWGEQSTRFDFVDTQSLGRVTTYLEQGDVTLAELMIAARTRLMRAD